MKKGLLKTEQLMVVLEGTGGAGKSTIAPMITESLRYCGLDVCLLRLPCYQTLSGVVIEEVLGERAKFPPGEATQMLFALNRREVAPYLANGIKRGWSFVVERWISSNALSLPEIFGREIMPFRDLLKNDERQLDRLLEPQFEWLRTIERGFLEIFADLPLTKIFLEVESGQARQSRLKREGLGEDIFEKSGTLADLREIMLERYLVFEGGWTRIERGGRSPNEIHNLCMEVTVGKAGVNQQRLRTIFTEGRLPHGRVLDFDEILGRVYPDETLRKIREGVSEIEWTRDGLEASACWRGIGRRHLDFDEFLPFSGGFPERGF